MDGLQGGLLVAEVARCLLSLATLGAGQGIEIAIWRELEGVYCGKNGRKNARFAEN